VAALPLVKHLTSWALACGKIAKARAATTGLATTSKVVFMAISPEIPGTSLQLEIGTKPANTQYF
jgi:hypothetical protein